MKLPGANRLAAALKATAIVIMLVLSGAANAAYLTNMPHIITQPDKSIVNCLVSGDEFYNWIHDADGYVIVQDHSDGWFVYATLAGGDVVGTQYVVGSVKPADVGLTPNIKPSVQKLQTLKAALFTLPMGMDSQPAPQSGAINNIAIYIRFSDDTEFTDAASSYNTIFNSTTSGTSSMRNYFWETSYNVLTINTTFYPTPGGATVVSYQDTNPRAYYLPYDATTNPIGYTEANNASREHTLLANAVNAVKSQIPTGLNVDADNDGEVDNVCFIVKGATSNWGTLLWPHAWFLYSQTVTINSKRVWGYNLQFGSWMMPSGVGVLAHEMMHSLGAPDLYHYTPGTAYDPVGAWDVMCGSGNPPQHTCAYMKYKYMNWISTLPVISTPGAYTLNPLTSGTGNCYKIAAAGTTSEFYVLEYRKRTAPFENSVPGSGLLVYRINTAVYGNSDGPPDEIYVYRPNGTNTVNGTLNSAHYSSSVGRTAINNGTNPAGFLTNGSLGGLNISNIGAAGATISFTVSFKLPNPTISPAGGTFTGSQTVTLALPGGIGNIYYTTDGTTPDTSDPYVNSGGTIVLNSSTTLNAKAFYTGYTASDMVSAAFVALPTYTITASAGANGTISPSGTVSVTHGTNKTFTFTANTGYVADQVTIDGGAPVAAGASYTFTNVQAAHTISITFKPAPTFTITASSDANGTISPTGAVIVTQGNNQTFTIAANSGYRVSRVLVDGVNVGAVTTYTFSNVIVAHTISAEFISTDFAAYWKFDETSGASAYDWSGNGKNGTLTNGPTWTAGLINNAVNIPGGTSYVSVPSGIVLGLINFSISTWVKLTTVATNMRIFDFGTSATNYMELTPKHSDTNGALQ
ncbi:MAG: M6 family metalloprotease domain-containing protein, partial [Armatimonadetes bacterium]|nr:M6 family metalloprotease domain-containing protein [Armatimonadota bacterium]